MSRRDLIVAIATAPGRGAVGMVRVSGPNLKALIASLFSALFFDQNSAVADESVASSRMLSSSVSVPSSVPVAPKVPDAELSSSAPSSSAPSFSAPSSTSAPFPFRPRHAHYLPFLAADGEVIDHGLVLYFPGPNSYTGEDVLELQGHGGPVVLKMLLDRVLEVGTQLAQDDARFVLRLAKPGEFTERAFLNDKLDLAQAEAVADLIDASTMQAARLASRSMEGVFSKEISALVEQLIDLRMLVEATLDFPEEEIDFLQASNALGRLAATQGQLDGVLAQAKQGRLMRDGLKVVLVGEPNVGKSSLLNALAGEEVAIVTPIAGTTRDRIAQAIQIEGVPITVIDTAGLRPTEDEVERMGIARTWAEIAKADVVLHLQDARDDGGYDATARAPDAACDGATGRNMITGAASGDSSGAGLSAEILERLPQGVPRLVLRNKIDLVPATDGSSSQEVIALSAKTGAGIPELRRRLLELAGWQPAGESGFIARERHLIALRAAQEHLTMARRHAEQNAEHLELFAEELRLAQHQLSEITGEFTPDDLLGVIFSRFCIGK
jgi:tRNA modification GTPase